jgi:purine-binding chemotaxis protein CheW
MDTQNETITKAVNSYLTFKLGGEEFAVHVNNVLNILEMTEITKVPQTPEYMEGVINLRGSVLPVIDTRLKLGMSATEVTHSTCIVVMEMNLNGDKIYIGSMVDQVEAVYEINDDQIQETPEMVGGINHDLLIGMTQIDEKFIMLLDIEKIMKPQELEEISQKTDNQNK